MVSTLRYIITNSQKSETKRKFLKQEENIESYIIAIRESPLKESAESYRPGENEETDSNS